MKMTTKPIGLYVHIPFCLRKCNYCDFCSFPEREIDWRNEYINALCAELESYRDKEISIDSVFFGGGTPSLLSSNEFSKITDKISGVFQLMDGAEFTIEANPKTIDKEKMLFFISCGVNRVSIGLQSIHENEMKILGRVHTFDEFKESYDIVRQCGINNINIDLMYGIPSQSIESFEKTLDEVMNIDPQHISLYGLIIEDETPFGKNRDKLDLPSDDTECDMYYLACKKLAENGYNHYEISNYAKEGFECRHNLKYWKEGEYIGIGVAAHSYWQGKRFGNSDDVEAYLHGDWAKYDCGEVIDSEMESYEFVMLGLRLGEGFSLSEYRNRFGKDFLFGREKIVDSLINCGYMRIEGDRIHLTERGFYVSNLILTELI